VSIANLCTSLQQQVRFLFALNSVMLCDSRSPAGVSAVSVTQQRAHGPAQEFNSHFLHAILLVL